MKHTDYARYLRETADLMGKAALGEHRGPWRVEPEGYTECGEPGCCSEWWGDRVLDADEFVLLEDSDGVSMEYIASWHPLIAAGVADLLTSVAIDIEANGEMYALTSTTVARAIRLAQQWRREGAFA